MKKLMSAVAALFMVFTLAACGSNGGSDSSKSSDADQSTHAKASKSSASKKQQQAQQQMQKQIKKGLLDKGKTVAIVNQAKITGKDYNAAYQSVAQQMYMSSQQQGKSVSNTDIAKQAKKQTIDSLVGEKLILQDAQAKGFTASKKEVQGQYDKMAKKYGGNKKLQSLLKAHNMSLDVLKKNISHQIVVNKYVDKEIGQANVTDKEIEQFYNQYSKGQKNAPELSKIKPQIKQQLQQQKQSKAIAKVVDKLKNEGKVDIKI